MAKDNFFKDDGKPEVTAVPSADWKIKTHDHAEHLRGVIDTRRTYLGQLRDVDRATDGLIALLESAGKTAEKLSSYDGTAHAIAVLLRTEQPKLKGVILNSERNIAALESELRRATA